MTCSLFNLSSYYSPLDYSWSVSSTIFNRKWPFLLIYDFAIGSYTRKDLDKSPFGSFDLYWSQKLCLISSHHLLGSKFSLFVMLCYLLCFLGCLVSRDFKCMIDFQWPVLLDFLHAMAVYYVLRCQGWQNYCQSCDWKPILLPSLFFLPKQVFYQPILA